MNTCDYGNLLLTPWVSFWLRIDVTCAEYDFGGEGFFHLLRYVVHG